jgi:RNA recognition motif-containing protein
MNKKLHVADLFAQDGRKVSNVSLVMSRNAGKSRGFAFVEMETDADANAALAALHGSEVDGRELRVTEAHPPRSRFGGRVGDK